MQKKLFLELMHTYHAHGVSARNGFSKMQLSDGQPKILYILSFHEGIVQKDLAILCNIKPSTLTVLLARLEEQGLIMRKNVIQENGKRARALYLTEYGRKKTEEVICFIDDLDEKAFEGFTEKERQETYDYLARLQKNLDKIR